MLKSNLTFVLTKEYHATVDITLHLQVNMHTEIQTCLNLEILIFSQAYVILFTGMLYPSMHLGKRGCGVHGVSAQAGCLPRRRCLPVQTTLGRHPLWADPMGTHLPSTPEITTATGMHNCVYILMFQNEMLQKLQKKKQITISFSSRGFPSYFKISVSVWYCSRS